MIRPMRVPDGSAAHILPEEHDDMVRFDSLAEPNLGKERCKMRRATSILLTVMFVCGSATATTVWDGSTWQYEYDGDVIPTDAKYADEKLVQNGSGGTQTYNVTDPDGGGATTVAVFDNSAAPAQQLSYRNPGQFDMLPGLLETRMRVDADATQHGHMGTLIRIYGDTHGVDIYIGKNFIKNWNGLTILGWDTRAEPEGQKWVGHEFDATQYHTYFLEWNGTTAPLYVDGVYELDVKLFQYGDPGQPSGVMIADAAPQAGTKSYWDYLRWNPDTVIGDGPGCDPGDADQDGDVDDDDLSLLLANWGGNVDCTKGEFSGVQPVNDDDLSLLLANWTGPLTAAVPEPATIGLIAFGGLAVLRRKR